MAKLPFLAFIVDFQSWQLQTSFRSIDPWYINPFIAASPEPYKHARKYRVEIDSSFALLRKPFGLPVIYGAYPWANHSVVEKQWRGVKIHTWDPSPWMGEWDNEPIPQNERTIAWSCASLMDKSDWLKKLNPEWPVVRHFPAKGKAGGGGKRNSVPDEKTLIKELYAPNAGALIPGHHRSKGAAFWRARIMVCASWVLTPSWGEPNCVGMIGDSWMTSLRDIETMSAAKRYDLACRQETDYRKWSRTKMQELDLIAKAVKAAREFKRKS